MRGLMSESMLEPDTTGRCLGREDASFISYNFLVSIFHNRQANCLEHGLPFICYRCPHLLLFLECSSLAKPGRFQISPLPGSLLQLVLFAGSTPGIWKPSSSQDIGWGWLMASAAGLPTRERPRGDLLRTRVGAERDKMRFRFGLWFQAST